MAVWDSPRQRLRQVERQLDELTQQQAETRRQMQQQGFQRVQQLEQEYRERFQRLSRETDAEYAQRLQQMQERILQANNAQLAELQAFDERCRREREDKLAELQLVNESLQQQLKAIQERSDQQERMLRREAETMLAQARQTNEQAQQTNHLFFFPDQLSVIESQMTRSVSMLDRGLYNVAAASALSAITEMELLILNVRQKESEWLQLFSSYAAIIIRVAKKLQAFCEERHETLYTREEEKPGHLLTERQSDYWSSGQYAPLCQLVEEAASQIRRAEEIGVQEYLRQGSALRAGQLVNAIRDARILEDRCTAVITSIRNELRFSDERYVLGCLLANALEELEYSVEIEGFEQDENGVEQPLGLYELQSTLDGNVNLTITISPVRENGVVMYNMVIVSVALPRLADPHAIRTLIASWQSRVQDVLMKAGVGTKHLLVAPARGGESSALIRELATRRPDPAQYAQKLALKY